NNMRPDFVQFNRCRRVLVEDIRLRESPFWCLHLALCEGAVVRRVDFSAHGHNNDGVDIALSRNVLVEDCSLDQGDDAIVVKSGSNQDGWRLAIPSENIVIRRCRVLGGHQLLAVGSDISAGVRNVYLHDCSCQDAKEVERLVQHILFIKTNRRRGGFVENIWVENVTAPRTRFGVLGIETDVMYQWRDLVPTYEERLTQIRGIHLRNVRVGETWIPIRILGDARLPVRDVYIEDLVVGKSSGPPRQIENAEGIHENNVRIIKSLADTPGGS
ncbi:MAG: glycosyl hydrolase family 28 protein, partial [Opitutaceae bacterium]